MWALSSRIASPGNLLDTQSLRTYPRSIEPEPALKQDPLVIHTYITVWETLA